MKVSVYPHPRFKVVLPGQYNVTMDGRRLERVRRVDTCTGVAWVTAVDAQGHLVIDRKREEVVERRVFGPMRLEPIEANEGHSYG